MKPYPTYQDFLSQLAAQPEASAENYAQYLSQVNSLQPFLKASATVMFLAELRTRHYPYMSPNTKQVAGHPQEAFIEGGLPFMFHHNQDFQLINQQMFPDEIGFLAKHTAVSGSEQFRFIRSYRFCSQEGHCRTLLQRTTTIRTTGQGMPVAALGFVWDITPHVEPGKLIHQIEQLDPDSGLWELRFSKEYYPDLEPERLLGKREVEVLKWAVEGYCSKQIADKLHISVYTVNTHRRNMLRKTNCQNALELLRYAIKHKLL